MFEQTYAFVTFCICKDLLVYAYRTLQIVNTVHAISVIFGLVSSFDVMSTPSHVGVLGYPVKI